MSENVWNEGDTPGVITLAAGSVPAELDAYVISRTGTQTLVWSHVLAANSGMTLPAKPFSIAGFYRVNVTSGTSTSVLTMSVIAQHATRVAGPPLFGINTHFAQHTTPDTAYQMLQLGNVELIRDQWQWSGAETSRGTMAAYTWPAGGMAHQKDMLLSHGLRILNNCAYGNDLYDSDGENLAFPTSASGIAGFANYCGFIAQQFGSTLYGSEIWNEPKVTAPVYAKLVQATANVLKQTVPSAQIFQGAGGGSGGGANPDFETAVYTAAGTSCCTGDSIHPYMENPDVGYLSLSSGRTNPATGQKIVNMDYVAYLNDIADHGSQKVNATNITEIGWTTVNSVSYGVSEEKQAAYVGRTLLHATRPSVCSMIDTSSPGEKVAPVCTPSSTPVAPDLKSVFIYDFQDNNKSATDPEQHFGIVNYDLTPKMAYSAFAQAAGILRGHTFYKSFRFSSNSLLNAYVYKVGATEGLLVLWTAEYAPSAIVTSQSQFTYSNEAKTEALVSLGGINTSSAVQQCSEWDGHPCQIDTAAIQVSNLPIYIRFKGSLDALTLTQQ